MNILARTLRAPLLPGALLTITLAACGGGGGGGADPGAGAPAPTSSWPTTGHYAVVLRASGSTAAGGTTTALSLVHAQTPLVEYVLDATPAPSALGVTLYGGTYDASRRRFGALSAVAHVDAPNGVLRTTILAANGAPPQQWTGPMRALCAGSVVANDYSDPFASRVVADTAGADGACGTADDGHVLIGFSSVGEPSVNDAGSYVGFLHSPATGALSARLETYPSGAETVYPIGTGGPAHLVGIGSPGATVAYARVADLDDTLLYARNGMLVALGNASGNIWRRELSLATGPEGWKSAGNDAAFAYAYLNSAGAESGTGTWQLLAVSRADLSVATIAGGPGSILAASAVPGAVYATVLDNATGASVARVDTATATRSTPWASASSITTVEANPGGLDTVTTVSGSIPTASVSFIDDAGNVVRPQAAGLMYGADGDSFDAVSGSRVFGGVYVVAPAAGSYLGGVPLTRVDAATRASTVLGTLPSGSDLGGAASDTVFVTPIDADATFGAFFASRLSGSQFVAAGSAVYTFDPRRAGSVVRTTSQVR